MCHVCFGAAGSDVRRLLCLLCVLRPVFSDVYCTVRNVLLRNITSPCMSAFFPLSSPLLFITPPTLSLWNSLNSLHPSLNHFYSLFRLLSSPFYIPLFVLSALYHCKYKYSLILFWFSNHVITPRHPTAPSSQQSTCVCMCIKHDYEMQRGYTCRLWSGGRCKHLLMRNRSEIFPFCSRLYVCFS